MHTWARPRRRSCGRGWRRRPCCWGCGGCGRGGRWCLWLIRATVAVVSAVPLTGLRNGSISRVLYLTSFCAVVISVSMIVGEALHSMHVSVCIKTCLCSPTFFLRHLLFVLHLSSHHHSGFLSRHVAAVVEVSGSSGQPSQKSRQFLWQTLKGCLRQWSVEVLF